VESSIETFRSLSQLEVEMRKTESAYIKADARFQDAEAIFQEAEQHLLQTQLERNAALRALNECHADLDRTVQMLREASPLGCEWKNQSDHQDAAPIQGNGRDVLVDDFMLKD